MRMPIDGYDGDRKRLVGATGRDKKPSCASPQQIEDKQAKTPLKKLPRSRCLCISQRKSAELAASVRTYGGRSVAGSELSKPTQKNQGVAVYVNLLAHNLFQWLANGFAG